MSSRYAYVTILAEDLRSANLLRRFVQRVLDLTHRQVYQEICPKGDAKQWVLNRYAVEVSEIRRKHHRVGLVVHLDADVDSVQNRVRQLADALRKNNLAERDKTERICHAIPRRHTETWLCSLIGHTDVDEEMDCKRLHRPSNPDQQVAPAAEKLYEITRSNAPTPTLPSLAAAVPELRRLEENN